MCGFLSLYSIWEFIVLLGRVHKCFLPNVGSFGEPLIQLVFLLLSLSLFFFWDSHYVSVEMLNGASYVCNTLFSSFCSSDYIISIDLYSSSGVFLLSAQIFHWAPLVNFSYHLQSNSRISIFYDYTSLIILSGETSFQYIHFKMLFTIPNLKFNKWNFIRTTSGLPRDTFY